MAIECSVRRAQILDDKLPCDEGCSVALNRRSPCENDVCKLGSLTATPAWDAVAAATIATVPIRLCVFDLIVRHSAHGCSCVSSSVSSGFSTTTGFGFRFFGFTG